jgi:hypothetical protein
LEKEVGMEFAVDLLRILDLASPPIALGDHAAAHGVEGEVGVGGDVHFFQDVLAVSVDGLGTEAEAIGDMLHAQAAGEEKKDFLLAIRKRLVSADPGRSVARP